MGQWSRVFQTVLRTHSWAKSGLQDQVDYHLENGNEYKLQVELMRPWFIV